MIDQEEWDCFAKVQAEVQRVAEIWHENAFQSSRSYSINDVIAWRQANVFWYYVKFCER